MSLQGSFKCSDWLNMSNVMRQRIPDRRSSMGKWTMSRCFGLYVMEPFHPSGHSLQTMSTSTLWYCVREDYGGLEHLIPSCTDPKDPPTDLADLDLWTVQSLHHGSVFCTNPLNVSCLNPCFSSFCTFFLLRMDQKYQHLEKEVKNLREKTCSLLNAIAGQKWVLGSWYVYLFVT